LAGHTALTNELTALDTKAGMVEADPDIAAIAALARTVLARTPAPVAVARHLLDAYATALTTREAEDRP
jgi:hypothetical protein